MGNSDSKDQEVKQIGDQQVTVIENQEVHTEMHSQHEAKLWIIIGMLTFIIALNLTKIVINKCRKEAYKAARSMAAAQNV